MAGVGLRERVGRGFPLQLPGTGFGFGPGPGFGPPVDGESMHWQGRVREGGGEGARLSLQSNSSSSRLPAPAETKQAGNIHNRVGQQPKSWQQCGETVYLRYLLVGKM